MQRTQRARRTQNLPRTRTTKRKKEFSQKLVTVILAIGVLNLVAHHVEVLYAISLGSLILPDSAIGTQTVITIFGGFTSYCLYQFGLKNSRNKYGVDADGQPYRTEPTGTDENMYME